MEVRQIGTPEQIYRNPTTAFVAEFLGVTNVLTGTLTPDGKAVVAAGTRIPLPADVPASSNDFTIVFKADAAYVQREQPAPQDAVTFTGDLVEVFFVGSTYRHYVKAGKEMLLVDSPSRVTGPRVNVIVPTAELKIYPGAPLGRDLEPTRSVG